MADAALLQPASVFLRHERWNRRHVDEYGAAFDRLRGPAFEEHLAYHGPTIEDRKDVVGPVDAISWTASNASTDTGKRRGLGLRAIPNRGREPRFDQIGGHRRAHDASAEKG